MNRMNVPAKSPDTIGAVAILVQAERILAIRRSATVAAPGKICFPGGKIESGESSEEAVRREIREELAISVRPIRQLWTSVTPWDVQLDWWQCSADSFADLCPNPREVSDVFWLTIAELKAHEDLLESNHAFIQAWSEKEFRIEGLGDAG
jgi:8-oxo-dGTP diphosphatase